MSTESTSPSLIDADVHPTLGDLRPYLPRVWHDRWMRIGVGAGPVHEQNPRGVLRRDAGTPDGGLPASDPAFMITDHLDRYDIDYAILTESLPMAPDPDHGNALAVAFNDRLIDFWLSVTPRIKASVVVNPNDPLAAAAEIRRVGPHRDMVQVIMPSASRAPYGQRQYHPIYEAASEVGLPVAIHPGSEGAGIAWPPTPVGYPSRYLEWHNILPITAMSQINSLICEGVFEKFPTLKFVVIEAGLAWMPHLMWRMDKNYKALRDTAPWLRRLPSEYVVEHVRLTTQPIEEPANPNHLAQILSMMSAERTVMFSSDYPHWDNDNPKLILRRVDPTVRARIFAANAAELYGLAVKPDRQSVPAVSRQRINPGQAGYLPETTE